MVIVAHDHLSDLVDRLNEAGEDGWDCIQVVELHGHLQALMKREVHQ